MAEDDFFDPMQHPWDFDGDITMEGLQEYNTYIGNNDQYIDPSLLGMPQQNQDYMNVGNDSEYIDLAFVYIASTRSAIQQFDFGFFDAAWSGVDIVMDPPEVDKNKEGYGQFYRHR